MPSWLLSLLEVLAKVVGLPVLKLLFPNVPASAWAIVAAAIEYIDGDPNPVAAAKKFEKTVRKCSGIACRLDLVKDK